MRVWICLFWEWLTKRIKYITFSLSFQFILFQKNSREMIRIENKYTSDTINPWCVELSRKTSYKCLSYFFHFNFFLGLCSIISRRKENVHALWISICSLWKWFQSINGMSSFVFISVFRLNFYACINARMMTIDNIMKLSSGFFAFYTLQSFVEALRLRAQAQIPCYFFVLSKKFIHSSVYTTTSTLGA